MVTKIGLSKGDVCAGTESPRTIVEALLVPEAATWCTMVMHTHPFSDDILQSVHPYHEVYYHASLIVQVVINVDPCSSRSRLTSRNSNRM